MWSYISNQVSNVLVDKTEKGIQTITSDQDRVIRTYKYDVAQLQSNLKAYEIAHHKSIQVNDELIAELNLYKSKIDEKRVLELSKRDFISLNESEEKALEEVKEFKPVDIPLLVELSMASDELFPLSQRSEKLKDLLFKEYAQNFTLSEYKLKIIQKYENQLHLLPRDILVKSLYAASVAADNFKVLFYKAIEKKAEWSELEISVLHTNHVFSSTNDLKLANIELRREIQSKTIELDKANNEILNLKNELKQYKNTSKILKTK